MKKAILIMTLLFSASLAKAQYQQSLGIALGFPSGFSYKVFPGSNNKAFEFTLGWTPQILLVSGIYEIHNPLTDQFTWYYGPGAHLGINNNDSRYRNGTLFLGIDGAIGIEFKPDIPVTFSIDLRPRFDIIGETRLVPQAQIGIRYILN
jgi:hypothetical protein